MIKISDLNRHDLNRPTLLTPVREMSGILLSQGNVREKILSGKSGLKLFIVSCIFASIQVFSRSLLTLFCVKY